MMLDKPKSFPLRVTKSWLDVVGEYAEQVNETKSDFILKAVEEKINRLQKTK